MEKQTDKTPSVLRRTFCASILAIIMAVSPLWASGHACAQEEGSEAEDSSAAGTEGSAALSPADGQFSIRQDIPGYAIVVDKDTTAGDYFPAPVRISGYSSFGFPLDTDGRQLMYTWCYEEGDPGLFLYYDDEGSVIRHRDTDPSYLGREGGMGRLYIYLRYPDAGVYHYYYHDTYFWVVMTNEATGYTYAVLLDYGLEKAEIPMPAGLYDSVYVSSSDNLVLPSSIYCPYSAYVYPSGYGHLDIVIPPGDDVVIDKRTDRVDLIGPGTPPTASGTAPVETAPDVYDMPGNEPLRENAAKEPLPAATAGGLLTGLDDDAGMAPDREGIEGLTQSLLMAGVILVILVFALIMAVLVRSLRLKAGTGQPGNEEGGGSRSGKEGRA